MKKRVRLEIKLSVLKNNFRKIQQRIAPCSVMSVLKADAYGLGVEAIAEALLDAGTERFGVAELDEAIQLKKFAKPIQIIGSILKEEIPKAVSENIIIPVDNFLKAQMINNEAQKQKKTATVNFLIDTGMGRLGIPVSDAFNTVKKAVNLKHIQAEGIYSHFPVAYSTGSEYTYKQIELFKKLLDRLEKNKISFDTIHIANSDAVNNFPESYRKPFNMVRTGINLHGAFDNEGRREMDIKSVLTLKSRLVSVRTLQKGSFIGYGRTCRLNETMKVGTVAAGYADGLPMALSNRGYFIIRDSYCPILGRVSMDYTTVSLRNLPEAEAGDDVTCLGRSESAEITVDDWAKIKGTHSYDIICSIGSRVQRKYID